MSRVMNTIVYYGIELVISGMASSKVLHQQEKNELFLSPNGVLTGLNKMAHLESKELAEQFKEACMSRLLKRYGGVIKMKLIEIESLGNDKRLAARISADSTLAKKRIETGILASNMAIIAHPPKM